MAKAAAEALSEEKTKREGNKCTKKERKKVKENKEIREIFLLECNKESEPEEEKRLVLMDKLIEKMSCNARFGAVIRLFKDHETGRRGDKKSDTALRAPMK